MLRCTPFVAPPQRFGIVRSRHTAQVSFWTSAQVNTKPILQQKQKWRIQSQNGSSPSGHFWLNKSVRNVQQWLTYVDKLQRRAATEPITAGKVVTSIKLLQMLPRPAASPIPARATEAICFLLQQSGSVNGQGSMLLTLYRTVKAMPELLYLLRNSQEFKELYRQALVRACGESETFMSPIILSGLSSAQVRFEIRCQEFWERLDHYGVEHLNPAGVAMVISAAAKAKEPLPAPLLDKLWIAVYNKAAGMDATSAVSTLSGLSTIGYVAQDLPEPLLAALDTVAPQLTASYAARALSAYAKLGVRSHDVPQLLLQRVAEVADSMVWPGLSEALWACAKLRLGGSPVSRALIRAVYTTDGCMNAKSVAQTLWAYATMGCHASILPLPLLDGVHVHACTMNAQEVANSLWALGKLGFCADRVPEPLLRAVDRVAGSMEPKGAGMAFWALAKCGFSAEQVPRKLLVAVRREAMGMDATLVAGTLVSFAKVGLARTEVPETLRVAVQRVAGQMSAQGVANALWAFAVLDCDTAAVPEALCRAVERLSAVMNSADIATAIWASTKLGLKRQAQPEKLQVVLRSMPQSHTEHRVGQKLEEWADVSEWACQS